MQSHNWLDWIIKSFWLINTPEGLQQSSNGLFVRTSAGLHFATCGGEQPRFLVHRECAVVKLWLVYCNFSPLLYVSLMFPVVSSIIHTGFCWWPFVRAVLCLDHLSTVALCKIKCICVFVFTLICAISSPASLINKVHSLFKHDEVCVCLYWFSQYLWAPCLI